MRRALYFILLLLLGTGLPLAAQSDEVAINSGGTAQNCGGQFVDTGLNVQGYGPNESFQLTLCPDPNALETHVRLTFPNVDIAEGDTLCFYDGTGTNAPALTCSTDIPAGNPFIIQASAANPSGCLTITFTSDATEQGAGWSAAISCITACQLIQAVLTDTDPPIGVNEPGYIDICPGDQVKFVAEGDYPQDGIVYPQSDFSSTFAWDFGDGTSAVGPEVFHTYDTPGGYIVQLTITDDRGCTNTNFLSQRVRVATVPTFGIGGTLAPEICAGDTVALSATITGLDSTANVSVTPNPGSFQVGSVRSDSLALPDGDGTSYETSISFLQFRPGQLLTDLDDLKNICVTMEHSWMRDLQIELICPDGTTVLLHDHPGQTGGQVYLGQPIDSDGTNPTPGIGATYCWTPDAPNPTWIQYANTNPVSTLPEGDYSSFEPLSNLLGCPLNGEWTIRVTDLWNVDNGFIFSWGITFSDDLYPNLETFTPNLIDYEWVHNPTIYAYGPDSAGINASPVNAGDAAYTFTVTDDFGCTHDTTVNFLVLPPTHPDCHSCDDVFGPFPDVAICEGETVQIDVRNPAFDPDADITFEAFPNYRIGNANHPPASPYANTINVNSILPTVINDATLDVTSVCVDLTTNFDADIVFLLEAPNGQQLELSSNNGGGGDNYTQTCFTPTATTPITQGTAPFTGNYQPEGDWSVLNGNSTNGNWTLLVSDAFAVNDFGTLNQWSITFNNRNEVFYSASPAADLSCDDCPDPIFTAGPTTTVAFEAIDSYGCLAEETVTVTVVPNDPPVIVCTSEDPANLIFSWNDVGGGSYTYEINVDGAGWITPNTSATAHTLFDQLEDVFVDVQVRVSPANNPCNVPVATASCAYTDNCFLELALDGPPQPETCPGSCDGAVSATGTMQIGAISYTLVAAADGQLTGPQPTGVFDNLCAGDYYIRVIDDMACTDSTDLFTVGSPLPITYTATVDAVRCAGESSGSVSLTDVQGGAGNYTYAWSDPNGQTSATATDLPVGTYYLTVTDGNCPVVDTFELTEPTPLLVSTETENIDCFGEATGQITLTPSGGNGDYSYAWSHGATTPAPNGLTAGDYTYTVTDARGCTVSETLTLSQPATALTATVEQTVIGCYGAKESEALVTPTGGTPPYSVQWSISGQTTFTGTAMDTLNYTVTVRDAADCFFLTTILIEDRDPIVPNSILTNPSCDGYTDGAIAINNVTGGSGDGYTYVWSTTPPQTGPIINGLAGDTDYTVTVTDGQGCRTEATRTLDNPPAVAFTFAVTDASCNGFADGTATVEDVTNAESPLVYQWGTGAGGVTTATAADLAAGTYVVTVTGDDGAGCRGTQTVTIAEPTRIDISFETLANDCAEDSAGAVGTLVSGGVPDYTYSWSTGSTTAKIDGVPGGTYNLTVTDATGCEMTDSASVYAPPPLVASAQAEAAACFGRNDGSITVSATGGTVPYLYSLDNQSFNGAATQIGLTAGTYTVYVRDANGCTLPLTSTVEEPEALLTWIEYLGERREEITLRLGDTVQLMGNTLNGAGDIDYRWTPAYAGILDSLRGQWTTIFPDNTTFYELVSTDENGCEANAFLRVTVEKDRGALVPTGFTPNGDSANDRLLVHGKEGIRVTTFEVFDRWGERVFVNGDFLVNDPLAGWDGFFRGQAAPAGVYIWHLEVVYADGLREQFRGETTLLR